jgi:flagellin-like protein
MKLHKIRIKNKRAVSEVIGYVIMVTIAIVLAGIVYTWLRTYVPKEVVECKDSVSLSVDGYKYEVVAGETNRYDLSVNFSNTGSFDIEGYYIKVAATDSNTMSLDLSFNLIETDKNTREGGFDYVRFLDAIDLGKQNSLSPGDKRESRFKNIPGISAIEIIPIRYEDVDGKMEMASCANSKFRITNIEVTPASP